MKHRKTLRSKYESFLYNHIWLKYTIDYGTAFIMSVLSAAIFAFGINCFLAPSISNTLTLVSGGSSGVGQIVALIFEIINPEFAKHNSIIYAIAYLTVNAPLIVIAFKGIGFRFGIFTLVNIGCVALFTNLFHGEFFVQIAQFVNSYGGLLSRALFAGVCTGLSSAIAFKFETSAGGFDIISYYLSLRKNTSAGKYGLIINACVILGFSILTGFKGQSLTAVIPGIEDPVTFSSWANCIGVVLFSLIYLLTVMLLIDTINVRNKKVQLQINTTRKELPSLLISNIPHGATIIQATGAYSKEPRLVIYMIVSTLELKHVLSLVSELDPNAFVNVTSLQQVMGRFFMKPVK